MFCLSIVITPWSCLMHTTLLYVQYFRNILHSSIKSSLFLNVVCFDFFRAHVSLILVTREGGFWLDSQKNSTHLFLCVVKCQAVGVDTGSKVRNSGGQVPYIWTSVGKSGLQCWGKMMRGNPFLGPRWLTPEPGGSKGLFSTKEIGVTRNIIGGYLRSVF